VWKLHADRGTLEATLTNGVLTVTRAALAGPELEGTGQGSIGLGDNPTTDFTYDITRLDLSKDARPHRIRGVGHRGDERTADRTSRRVALPRARRRSPTCARPISAQRPWPAPTDATIPGGDLSRAHGRVEGDGFVVDDVGSIHPADQRHGDARRASRSGWPSRSTRAEGRSGRLDGSATLHADNKGADRARPDHHARARFRGAWCRRHRRAAITWTDAGVDISPVEFVNGRQDERVAVSGTWRTNGNGALRVRASHVYLDNLGGLFEQPARYGGLLDLTPRCAAHATTRGSRRRSPSRRAGLNGSTTNSSPVGSTTPIGTLDVDLRLDQSPGVWVTAAGKTPLALFTEKDTEQPIDVAVKSSGIDLGPARRPDRRDPQRQRPADRRPSARSAPIAIRISAAPSP
jgi:hypothetical protein